MTIVLEIYAALTVALFQDVASISRDPPTANPRSDSVDASCGDYRVRISGFGARSFEVQAAALLADGAPMQGEHVDALLSDLSQRGAVYRFGVICRHAREITVRIDRGQRQRDGSVDYTVGLAVLNGTQLTSYSGLDEADHETFWF